MTEKNVLFIDPSSEHLAYALFGLHEDLAVIKLAGMVWTSPSWSKGRRFSYVNRCIKYLLNKLHDPPSLVVTEQYFMNPKLRVGVAVIPTINGIIEMNADDENIEYIEMPPTEWRKLLEIKPVLNSEGKRDYKKPTADVVNKYITMPLEILSNYTLKLRTVPHDLTDALAIGLAYCKKQGLNKVESNSGVFTNPIVTNELFKLKDKNKDV